MPEAGFGLYLHWPFCQAKCPYCDFNSHVQERIDQASWRDAYLREIDRIADLTSDRILRSVYFGGGTPSLMPAETVDAILDRIASHWRTSNDVEITLEANPTSVEAGRFAGYRSAGVNRVSLGVQALDDDDLRRLGRMHTSQEARAALDVARNAFERVSFDLIYARQDQTAENWAAELGEALSLRPSHLSLYQLTIEPGTVFAARHARGQLRGLPDEDRGADLWDLTQEMCQAAGLPAYEVSNHAVPGQESEHNLIYWRGGEYAGVGPGAHGRLTLGGVRNATETVRDPSGWLKSVLSGDGGHEKVSALSDQEIAEERLLMGLRTIEGLPLADVEAYLSDQAVEELQHLGLLIAESGNIRATKEGRPLLNAILEKLLV